VGAPFRTGGTFDDMELVTNLKSRQLYPRQLCHSKQCGFSWVTAFTSLGPYLPKSDYRPHFRSCAVVSSSKQLVYGNTSWDPGSDKEPERRPDGYGEEIDRHYMVLRLDNAPLDGYTKWVGSRTTHRLVQADYARMVMNILGTEQIVNNTKSVVTPSTWWVGGYPQVEKVTYLMSVPGTPTGNGRELRAPDHGGYTPFTEVFPGNRRLLLSPIFLRRALETTEKLRHSLVSLTVDCMKQQTVQPRLSATFVAVLFSLQVCDRIDVYGVSPGARGGPSPDLERVVRDSKFRPRPQESPANAECCYYPVEEDYTPEVPLCDEITRRYAFRLFEESANIAFHG